MKLDHIVLLVRDFAVSMPFYEALLPLLGFTKTGEHVFGDGSGLFLDFRLASPKGQDYDRYGVGLNHLGFTARSREDVDGIAREMADRGFDVPDVQLFDEGDYALFVRDLDGMRIEITHYPGD